MLYNQMLTNDLAANFKVFVGSPPADVNDPAVAATVGFFVTKINATRLRAKAILS